MPLLVPLILAAIPTGALALKTFSDEAEQTATNTGSQIVTLAAAGLGLWMVFNLVRKGKPF